MAKKWTPKSDDDRNAEVDALKEQLQTGVAKLTSEKGWADWLEFQSKLYTYSFNNTILIQTQHPGAKAVAGYKAWQKMGRNVIKGEKSHIGIFAPLKRSFYTETTDAETGETKKVRCSRCVGFKVVKVFEAGQTEGDSIPERPEVARLRGDDDGLIEVLKGYAEGLGCSVKIGDAEGANGFYRPSTREIVVDSGMEPAAQAKTLAHEIGHHLLHGGAEDRAALTRADRELEAESFAFIVCKNLGLETAEYSFAYVAFWKGKKAEDGLQESGKRIADAAKKALGEIDLSAPPMSKAA